MNNSELLDYSEEHVDYEVTMFFRLGKLLLSKYPLPPTDIVVSVDYALIESFVMHFRSLCDFFYSKRKKQDDVLAEDFFAKPANWTTLRPPLSCQIEDCISRVNKEVVHITELRFYAWDPRKPWPVPQMIQELKRVVNLFTINASSDKLHSKVLDSVQQVDSLLAVPRRFRFQIDVVNEC